LIHLFEMIKAPGALEAPGASTFIHPPRTCQGSRRVWSPEALLPGAGRRPGDGLHRPCGCMREGKGESASGWYPEASLPSASRACALQTAARVDAAFNCSPMNWAEQAPGAFHSTPSSNTA